MRRLRIAVLVSIASAAPAPGQDQASVPRAIQMPDTMGANFPVADTLTGTSGPADYDFLVGTWRFTFQERQLDVSDDGGTPYLAVNRRAVSGTPTELRRI